MLSKNVDSKDSLSSLEMKMVVAFKEMVKEGKFVHFEEIMSSGSLRKHGLMLWFGGYLIFGIFFTFVPFIFRFQYCNHKHHHDVSELASKARRSLS